MWCMNEILHGYSEDRHSTLWRIDIWLPFCSNFLRGSPINFNGIIYKPPNQLDKLEASGRGVKSSCYAYYYICRSLLLKLGVFHVIYGVFLIIYCYLSFALYLTKMRFLVLYVIAFILCIGEWSFSYFLSTKLLLFRLLLMWCCYILWMQSTNVLRMLFNVKVAQPLTGMRDVQIQLSHCLGEALLAMGRGLT